MTYFKEDSTSILDYQINEIFGKRKDSETDMILKVLSLLIYQNANNTDILELYKLLGPEDFSKVLMLFDGRYIKLPSGNEFKEYMILSLVYYYRIIKNESWEKVKERFPFPISSISYGIKLKQLNNFLVQKIDELFKNMEKKEEK